MGYTHYIRFKSSQGNSDHVEKQYQLALKKCNKLVFDYNQQLKKLDPKNSERLSGYSAYTKKYGGLMFNGTKELSHEDFCLREHYKENFNFEFCKTAQKPYDKIVVACLILLKHYLKGNIEVSSDGSHSDWLEGLFVARSFTKLKTLKIPNTIEKESEAC